MRRTITILLLVACSTAGATVSNEQWVGLVGALLLTGPLVWTLFKDLLAEVEKEINAKPREEEDSASRPRRGYYEEFFEYLFGRVRFLFHFVFPLAVFFLFWAVFTSWA